MNFLNTPLAWGAIAASIPLILHILNRSKFRRVEWGAMHLLESVIKVNHKRFRFEQLILLLVRCAIPALLAFCLARPVLTGAEGLAGDSPSSIVILLDTSYSMDAKTDGTAHFDEAVDAACAIVESTGRGSEIAVIQTGGGPTPLFDQPVFDPKAVTRRLRAAQAGFGASDMQRSLDAGLATLAGMTNARKELVVISDFQPGDWNTSGNLADSIREQVAAMNIKPELTLLPIGKPVTGNVSVESLEFSKRPLGVGHQLSVRANLRNHGTTPVDNARVVLNLDGTEHSVSQVTLGANASTQTLFPCEFTTSGSHVIEVEVQTEDPLPTDNQFSAAVTIWDAIDVLLVDGDPNSQPLKSETDFLSVALTPFSLGRMKLADLVKTRVIRNVNQLKKESFEGIRVVVLANVERVSDQHVTALAEFVEAGGALIVCAGNKIDTRWYNQKLVTETRLLPAEFGAPRGMINETGKSTRIVAQRFDHPALQFFNDGSNGDLSTAEIRQWYELKPANSSSHRKRGSNAEGRAPAASSTSEGAVIATLETGEPLLIEHRVGDGVVVQMATACDADWSDLPMRPFFVPLMQQLVTTMATQLTPPRNIQTGEPAVALFAATDETSDATVSIETPAGTRRTLKPTVEGNLLMARFESTVRPGIYDMTAPDGATIHFVASTARDESNLATLDEPQLKSLSEDMSAKVVASSTEYLEQDRLRRHGREIWKYVLAALLAFMFLELVLQQRFSRVHT